MDDLIAEFRALQVEQSQVLDRLRRARRHEAVTTTAEARTVGRDAPITARFPIGANIVILQRSRVRRPVDRLGDPSFDIAEERFGTVSGHEIGRNRVLFITRNGTDTWRAPDNLRLALSDE